MRKLILLLPLVLLSNLVWAHESRPLYIQINEDSTHLNISINLPNTLSTQNFPLIYLDTLAINQGHPWASHIAGFRQQFRIASPPKRLKGSTLTVEYPLFNPVLSTISVITYLDGIEQRLVLPPNKTTTQLTSDGEIADVRIQYCWLGVEHIWAGVDHLLFVVCLLIIAGFNRKLLITITGFTLTHSVTLALSALDLIRLPIPPIEATIALSLVFLCYEIIHHHWDKNSLTYRYPILVASSFGLLHGLGFAAVLGEIGLPAKHRVEALLFFNIGVEIGQLLFLAVLFLLAVTGGYLAKGVLSNEQKERWISIGLQVSIYLVGTIAAYWMFDRIWV